jgi:hypothetical protein
MDILNPLAGGVWKEDIFFSGRQLLSICVWRRVGLRKEVGKS